MSFPEGGGLTYAFEAKSSTFAGKDYFDYAKATRTTGAAKVPGAE